MRIQALHDKIIVIPEKDSEIKQHGIILPLTRQHKNLRGTVYSAGPEALSCHEGDLVCYDKMMGQSVMLDEKEYCLLREGDIIAILKSAE